MRWTATGRWLVAGLVAAGLVFAGVGPSGAVPSVDAARTHLQQTTPTPTNDTRHVDPDRVDEPTDLSRVQGWLASRMTTQLEDCVVELGIGSTDVCRFEDDYPDWLTKYVDVAEETDDEGDDRHATAFDRTRRNHRNYAENVTAFRETYEAYREARAAGDDERARRSARELRRRATDIHAMRDAILRDYGGFEGASTIDLDDARSALNATVADVTETVEAVEAAEFVPTTLQAAVTPRRVSFTDPGTVTGRLTTEPGAAIANRSIVVVVGERSVEARTDADGRFSATYRPTTRPVGPGDLVVRYVPRAASAYLGSTTTVPVSIEAVEPRLTVSTTPNVVRFGDRLRVSGRVAAEVRGVPGVPVVIAVDDRRLGTATTNASGFYAVTAAVTATAGPGAVEAVARLPLEGRAIARTSAAARLTVEAARTTLGLDATPAGPSQLVVAGSLRTADGVAVADQRIDLGLNGSSVATARTGPDGRFEATVTVPSRLRGSAVEAAAVFAGTGTNLEPSRAETVVRLPAGGPPSGPDGLADGGDVLDAVALGLGSVVLLGALWFLRRRWLRSGADEGRGASSSAGRADRASAPTPERSRLESARGRLDADADAAVMLAYAAVRERLIETRELGGRDDETHWEFLARCRADGFDDAALERLTRLTEAYERAAYAPVAVDRSDAESSLADAAALV